MSTPLTDVGSAARVVALFGGIFDPPHLGHVAIVELVAIRPMLVVVSGHPPHRDQPAASMGDRFEMARRSFEHLPGVSVSSIEIERAARGELTYTIDTVAELARSLPGHRIALVIGADQARDFPSWHRWGELAAMVDIHVVARDVNLGVVAPAIEATWHDLDIDISSTAVRQLLREGQLAEAQALVPAAVRDMLEPVYLPQNQDDQ